MKPKKFLCLILASLITVPMLAACAGKSSSSSEASSGTSSSGSSSSEAASSATSASGKATVTFWTLSTRQTAVDEAVKEFQAKNPDITVKASYFSTDGIKQALKVAASSKTLPTCWFNWGGALGGYYSDNDLTYDLTQYAKDNGWDKKFQPSVLQLVTRDGKVTGYPTSLNEIGVFYRKDIFQKYNVSVPTTFDQFEQACATLKSHGVTPISTGGKNGWHVMRFVELLIEYYAGADTHDSLDTFKTSWAGNKAVIQALAKYKEFADKGYFPKGFVTADPDNVKTNLYDGSCAMETEGPWWDSYVISDKQDMSKYDYFPFPSGGKNRMSAFAEMTQFRKGLSSDELGNAMKFTSFYNTESFAEKYPGQFNLPLPLIGAKIPSNTPHVAKMLSDMNKNGTFTITDQAFPPEIADVLFAAQDSIATGSMTPEQGAKNIQDAIDKYKAANE